MVENLLLEKGCSMENIRKLQQTACVYAKSWNINQTFLRGNYEEAVEELQDLLVQETLEMVGYRLKYRNTSGHGLEEYTKK